MNNRSLTRWTLPLFVLLLLAPVAAPALHAAEVRFQLVQNALILVPVTANDAAPVYFLLDTGADTTIVDTALAKKLNLPTLKQIQQTAVTGSQTVGVGVLAKLSLAGVEVDSLPVLEQDLSGLRRVDARIAGIVGQNFLARFNYLVDYRAHSLQIEEKEEIRATLDGEAVAVEVIQHRMILAAEATVKGGTKLRLLLDSGANALVLMGQAASALDSPMLQAKVETSAAGAAAVRAGRVDLTVAAHAFRGVPASLMPNAPPQPIGDGLLPMALFDAVYVNNAQGYVVLNPRVRKLALLARVDGE